MLTRRAALTATTAMLASAGIGGTRCHAAEADMAAADAELTRLADEFERLEILYTDAVRRQDEAEQLVNVRCPPRPEMRPYQEGDDQPDRLRALIHDLGAHRKAWAQEKERIQDETGLSVAIRDVGEVGDKQAELAGQAARIHAVGLAGLKAKARIAQLLTDPVTDSIIADLLRGI